MGSYWYKEEVWECCLCGKEKHYKYRVYDEPKPEDLGLRIVWHQDVCGEHFM